MWLSDIHTKSCEEDPQTPREDGQRTTCEYWNNLLITHGYTYEGLAALQGRVALPGCVFQTLNVVSYDLPAVYSFSVCMCVHCSCITANQGGDRINKMLTCIYGFEIHRLC